MEHAAIEFSFLDHVKLRGEEIKTSAMDDIRMLLKSTERKSLSPLFKTVFPSLLNLVVHRDRPTTGVMLRLKEFLLLLPVVPSPRTFSRRSFYHSHLEASILMNSEIGSLATCALNVNDDH